MGKDTGNPVGGKRGRPRKKKKPLTEERRQKRAEYQKQYYQQHKEKAREYQRVYNLTHKKKRMGRGKKNFTCPREAVQTAFNSSDIMNAPTEKAIKMLDQILRHERIFTM